MIGQQTTMHETDARNRFDDWSESSTFQRLRPWLAYVQKNILGELNLDRVTRVLDVACGSGWAVFEIARRINSRPNTMACGCDISEGMLRGRALEPHEFDGAYFLAASAQSLPFSNDCFDAVVCTAAFHHFPKPLEGLREFRRVLAPGGVVLIADTCRDQTVGTWVWDRFHRWFEKGHVKYYRTDEMLSLLTEGGLVQVRMRELRPSYAETKKLVRRTTLFRATSP